MPTDETCRLWIYETTQRDSYSGRSREGLLNGVDGNKATT